MANKKLLVCGGELKLPMKKVKGEKKPRWKAKTGGTKVKESVVGTPFPEEITLTPEPTVFTPVATAPET